MLLILDILGGFLSFEYRDIKMWHLTEISSIPVTLFVLIPSKLKVVLTFLESFDRAQTLSITNVNECQYMNIKNKCALD